MLITRSLTGPEVETLVGWAGDEGWNPGLADAGAFRAADAEGFLGAFVGGEMVSGISAVAYGDGFGFIGLYICRPDRRGRGFGKAVWDASMGRLGNRTLGLDGVPAQQANYRSMGFAPAYRTVRYGGAPRTLPLPASGTLAATADSLPLIAEYDAACFPAPRREFLSRWLAPPRSALMFFRGDRLAGYGVVRACLQGAKIGPLFADDVDAAKAIFAALARQAGGEVHVDVPDRHTEFAAFLTAIGLSAGFETARMYRGAPPLVDEARVFGITTLELG